MSVAVMDPVIVPTSLGTREQIDLAASVLDFQKIENPQVSIHQCSQRFGPQAVRSIFERLVERAEQARFEDINLSDNCIGDEGVAFLAQGLRGNVNLKRLLLPRAGIGAKGFQALGTLLGAAPALEELVLSSNACDADGVGGEFGKGLAQNKSLRSLVLAVCRLGDKGVAQLCDGPLKSHPKLEHLCLTYNRLEAGCITSLNKALALNQALRYLDLCGNSLGPDGAVELVKGLEANKGRLQRLGVAQNSIRLRGARALVTFFQSATGKNMQYLDLRHNLVTYRGVVELRAELKMPLESDSNQGWLLLCDGGERQLLLNAH